MILTSRKMRTNRNFLTSEEQATVDKYRTMVANELQQWCATSDLTSIKLTPKDQLIRLHHSLGTAIRNDYELWMPEHEVTAIWKQAEAEFPLALGIREEDIQVGDRTVGIYSSAPIEDHPCHPDNFSYSCIEKLWENLQ